MRAVTVKVWVPATPQVAGHYETRNGVFHRWGDELFEASGEPTLANTVGIVELDDGTVLTACPSHIKFEHPEA